MGREPPSIPEPGSELERFFDLSLDLLVIAGMDGYMKRVNPAYVRTLGYPVEELLARPMLAVVHPDDVASVGEVLGGLVEGKDVIGFENRVICADGSVRWLQWNTTAVPEQGIVYGVGRDVTDRRRTDAERRVLADEQAALRRVATLVARGASPAEVFRAVAAEVGVLFGSDVSAIVRFEDDGTATVLGDVGGPHDPGERVTLDPGYVVHTVRETRPLRAVRHGRSVGRGDGSLVRSLGIRSAVASPIVVEGELWGAITAASLRGPLAPSAERRLHGLHGARRDRGREHAGAREGHRARRGAGGAAAGRDAGRGRGAPGGDLRRDRGRDRAAVRHRGDSAGALPRRPQCGHGRERGQSLASFRSASASQPSPVPGRPSRVCSRPANRCGSTPTRAGDGPVAATLRRMGIRSGVCAPIYVEGRLWGSINTGSPQEEPLPPDAESRLAQFTDLLATAIANTESRAEVERLAEEQAALRRVATLVAENPESEELFSAVAREVAVCWMSAA